MTYDQVVKQIYQQSPLQKKKIEEYLSRQPESFFEEANKFIAEYSGYLNAQGIPFEYAIDAYLNMCKNMVKSQIFFMKNDKYPVDDQYQAFNDIYNDKKIMKQHVVGIALSQYMWETHYKMFKHFQSIIDSFKNDVHRYLEIGPGHGLYLKYAIEQIGKSSNYVAVDISNTSLNLTKKIISFFNLNKFDIDYINDDMLNITSENDFDFISMGEVLEHVDNPQLLLTQLKLLLSENGRAFISTCVNCPTIDHVYHFKTVEEIREMINITGLSIKDEKVLPVENLPMNEIIKKKITINYSAEVVHN